MRDATDIISNGYHIGLDEMERRLGYYIGIGQRYYFTNFLAFRVELRNYAYTQRVDSNYNNRNNLLLSGGFSFLL